MLETSWVCLLQTEAIIAENLNTQLLNQMCTSHPLKTICCSPCFQFVCSCADIILSNGFIMLSFLVFKCALNLELVSGGGVVEKPDSKLLSPRGLRNKTENIRSLFKDIVHVRKHAHECCCRIIYCHRHFNNFSSLCYMYSILLTYRAEWNRGDDTTSVLQLL